MRKKTLHEAVAAYVESLDDRKTHETFEYWWYMDECVDMIGHEPSMSLNQWRSFRGITSVTMAEASQLIAGMRKEKQSTSTSEDLEAIRLAVEVASLIRRFGYTLKDDKLMEVIKLCSKIAEAKS
jgi:hypothetical protein